MTGISIREFARRDGCDDKLVRRAITSGYLIALPDGTLDPDMVGTGWRLTNRRNSASSAPPADKNTNVRTKVSAPVSKAPEPPIAAVIQDLVFDAGAVDELEGFITRLLAGQFATRAQAETVKENALALKHVLAARRDAGSLVEIEDAERVIFESLRAARDAWLNWPVRIGPVIAADLGLPADRVTEVLSGYVHQQLSDLGEPSTDFRGR